MIEAFTLIVACFLLCLLVTPFLALIWIIGKWSKWCQRMVNGDDDKQNADVLKLIVKLLSK